MSARPLIVADPVSGHPLGLASDIAGIGRFDGLETAFAACSAADWLSGQQWLAAFEGTAAVALMAEDAATELETRSEAASQPLVPPLAVGLPAIPAAVMGETVTLEGIVGDDIPPMPRLTLRRFAAAVGGLLGLAAVTAVAIAPASDPGQPAVRLVLEQVALVPATANTDHLVLPLPRVSRSEVVNRGETVSSLLARLGANDAELIRFVGTDRIGKRLLQLQPGRTVSAVIDDVGVVHRLQYRHGGLGIDGTPPVRITIVREGGRLVASEQPVTIERGVEARAAEIRSTLFAATDAAGIPDSVATRAADILGNSIDLRKDLRRGAELRVVFETLREADSLDLPIPGRVLALELVSGRIRHEAVWFEHDDGKGAYYNFAGQSLVRSFLREPIEYTRITSGFSGARLHPLFRDVREHTGTDFAAPIGTRIRSVADGIVDFAGYSGGYGRAVIVAHPGRITTLYAHLNAFGDGIVKGARVSQGQVLGTVGMTGWTTGPHLHYEFRVNGRHIDPMRAVLPEGRKLSMGDRLRFAPLAGTYREHMARIEAVAGTSVARFE